MDGEEGDFSKYSPSSDVLRDDGDKVVSLTIDVGRIEVEASVSSLWFVEETVGGKLLATGVSLPIFEARSLVMPAGTCFCLVLSAESTIFLITSSSTLRRFSFNSLLAKASLEAVMSSEMGKSPAKTRAHKIGFFGSWRLNRRLLTLSRYSFDIVPTEL